MADDPEDGGGPDRRRRSSEPERLLEVYQGWKKAGRSPMRFSWRTDHDGSLAFAAAAGLLLLQVTPVDAALWSDGDVNLWSFPLPVTGRILLWALLPVCLLNSLLSHRLLSRKTPADLSTRWQLLALRGFVLGLPLVGWSAFPVWSWLLKRRPSWMLSPRVNVPELLLRHDPGRRLVVNRWMGKLDESMVLLLVLNNSLLLHLASYWIQVVEPESPDLRWWLGLVYSLTFHLLAFAGMAWYLRVQIERSRTSHLRSLGLLILTACLLPPIPVFSVLLLLFLFLVDPSNTAGDTLAHALSSQRGTTRQLPVWWELREKVQSNRRVFSWWNRLTIAREEAGPPPRDAARHIRLLLRRKTLSLVPDVMAFQVAVPLLAPSWPRTSLLLDGGLSLVGLLALPLLAAGLAALGLRVALRRKAAGKPSGPLDQHFLGACLARTATLYTIGLLAGHLWRRDQMDFLENLFLYTVAAALLKIGLQEGWDAARQLLSWGDNAGQQGREAWDNLRRIFPLIGLSAASGVVLALAQLGLGKLFVIVWLPCSFLWGARLARTHLPWLLRPSPGQPFPELPPGRAAFIRLTALLPLGGLAVPLWLLTCRQQKTAGSLPPSLPVSNAG